MSSIYLYGPPGTGKTTLAASLTKLNYIPLFIDFDHKIKTMKNLQEQRKKGLIRVLECPYPVNGESLKSQVSQIMKYYPKINPKGYVWLAETLDNLQTKPPKDHERVVPVIDSLSRVNEHLKSLIKCVGKQAKMEFNGWDAVLTNYETLFDTFYGLQPGIFPHCVIISHSKDDKDEVLNRVESRPLIDGSFRDKAGSYVEEMYYTRVTMLNEHQPAKFEVLTKPNSRVLHARSSRDLGNVEIADFEVLFNGEDAKDGKTDKQWKELVKWSEEEFKKEKENE